jgi:hypothetical protein
MLMRFVLSQMSTNKVLSQTHVCYSDSFTNVLLFMTHIKLKGFVQGKFVASSSIGTADYGHE